MRPMKTPLRYAVELTLGLVLVGAALTLVRGALEETPRVPAEAASGDGEGFEPAAAPSGPRGASSGGGLDAAEQSKPSPTDSSGAAGSGAEGAFRHPGFGSEGQSRAPIASGALMPPSAPPGGQGSERLVHPPDADMTTVFIL